MKNVFQANETRKLAGIAIRASNKRDLKLKLIVREKGHVVLIKETFNLEDNINLNIYSPNSCAPDFIKALLLDLGTEINIKPVTVNYFNILLSLQTIRTKK